MSLQRLQLRRPTQRPTQQASGHKKTKRQSHDVSATLKTKKNTRRRRIYDLLSHIPTFMIRFLRLLSFVVFLLPAFVVFLWHYLTCDRVAAYYGKHECCAEEGDHNRNNGAGKTTEKSLKCKDPLFSRHYLDIYGSRTPTPEQSNNGNKKPVVIFLTGGAWIIGYRMWGTLLGRALAPFGILVIMPDYRNFPRVNIEGMVHDVDMSIQWVLDHAEEYGGDPEKVVLVGQSAGAHIGGVVVAMKVLDWLRKERRSKEAEGDVDDMQNESEVIDQALLNTSYSPRQLCGFISTSAPHNLVTMRQVFHHHGLSADVQKSIFGGLGNGQNNSSDDKGENVFERWSPYHLVAKSHEEFVKLMNICEGKSNECPELRDIFPNWCVIHGTADKTVPVSEAVAFVSLLWKLEIPNVTKMYKDWTHTDPILEAPMRGDHTYHRDVYELVRLWTEGSSASNPTKEMGATNGYNQQPPEKCVKPFDEKRPMLQPICPSVLVEAARSCNPF